jgi:hypothetical protein
LPASRWGALLQNRLAVALQDRAERRTGEIPPQFRQQFVDGFSAPPKGVSGWVWARPETTASSHPGVSRTARAGRAPVFTHGFVDAMHPTLILPILVVLAAATGCLAIQSNPKPRPQTFEQPEDPSERERA